MNDNYIVTKYRGRTCGLLTDERMDPVRIDVENDEIKCRLGSIYAARVCEISDSTGAVFVELADKEKAYLPKEEEEDALILNAAEDRCRLCCGDLILVQVCAEAVKSKLPSVTAYVSLAGSLAVAVMNRAGLGFSKKLDDKDLKTKIKEICSERAGELEGFYIVVRTAASAHSAEETVNEAISLKHSLSDICERAKKNRKICMLKEGENIFVSSAGKAGRVITDDVRLYDALKRVNPDTQLYEDRRLPLTALYGFERAFKRALSKTVWLKSGAFLVIEPTEALVSIDVNTGKSDKDFLSVNLEACEEIARQLILRNLSGMIIADLISMKSKDDQEAVLKKMRRALKDDPGGAVCADITKLGLLEITRKKVRQPLYEIFDI